MAGWDHVPHIDEKTKAELLAATPAHMRDARSKGIPIASSGLIFASVVPEDQIVINPIELPKHWPRIAGIDFGWDHPTAGAWLAWDRDSDTVYLYDDYAERQKTIPIHASVFRNKGVWIPVAWPHDGYQVKDAMQGEQLAQQYKKEGLNMLPMHAQFQETGIDRPASLVSVEAGIQEMLNRMETGRFKVFKTCEKFLSEFRIYRREKGLIVKLGDDVISATRYACVMLRYATIEKRREQRKKRHKRPINWRAV